MKSRSKLRQIRPDGGLSDVPFSRHFAITFQEVRMLSLRVWRSFCLAATVLAVVAVAPSAASASVIQSTPSLPPEGQYVAATVCFPHLGPGVCIVGASMHGFTGTTSMFDNQGQSIDSSISLTADVYTDVNNMPGTLIGPVLLQGPIGILYSGRMNDEELGTFTSTMTELDLTGTFHGITTHTVEIILNPMMTTSGPTTVAQFGSDFQVTSFFDVFADISIDHGQFMPAPSSRTFTLVPTPEPGSISLLTLGFLGITGELRRRVRAAKPH
jgi:hypothetical protein